MSADSPAPLMVAPFRLDSLREPPPPPPPPPAEHGGAMPCTRTGAGVRAAASCCSLALLVLVAAGGRRRGRAAASSPDPPPAVTPVLARTVGVPPQAVHAAVADDGSGRHRRPGHRRRRGVGTRAAGAGGQPDQADDRLRGAARPPAGARTNPGPTITVTPGRRRRLRQRHRRRRLQRAGHARRAVDGAAGAERPARALGGQLRRPAGPLGRRQHPGLRGQDERGRRRASAWTSRTSPTPSGVEPGVGVDRRRTCSRWRRPTWPIRTFASIVKMPSVTLPVAGTISTYTPLLGLQGVIGVKSGFTTAAGGCDVLAVDAHRARPAGAPPGRGDRADRARGAGAGRTARAGAGRRASAR